MHHAQINNIVASHSSTTMHRNSFSPMNYIFIISDVIDGVTHSGSMQRIK